MDTLRSEETTFVIEEVSAIVKETVEHLIGGHVYQHEKINRWAADIVDQVLNALTNQEKPFKYIVQAVIMQKNGAGLHAASSCFWDKTNDASCFVRKINKMCGRFACGLAPDVVRRLSTYMHSQTQQPTVPPFIDLMPSTRSFRPSWNLAPASTCLCLISGKHLDETEDSSTRVLCSMRWALVPHYYKGSLADFKPTLNNCRSETLDEKPSFKGPLKNGQRCVVLAEGFFEWNKTVARTPYFIYQSEPMLHEKHYPHVNADQILERYQNAGGEKLPLLAMAGLFDINEHCETETFYSCTICTVDASEAMQSVHIRMPAILSSQKDIGEWLDFGRYDKDQVLPLLVPHDDVKLYRVTPSVGSTKVNDMNNIRPIHVDKENKVTSPNRNTLDSFVIKKAPSKYFDDRALKDESNKPPLSRKRIQEITIDDDEPKDSKTSVKRLKK